MWENYRMEANVVNTFIHFSYFFNIQDKNMESCFPSILTWIKIKIKQTQCLGISVRVTILEFTVRCVGGYQSGTGCYVSVLSV